MSLVKCGRCGKPIMVYIEEQVDDKFDKMLDNDGDIACNVCGKQITVHQKVNKLVLECPEHGVVATMEKRGYFTARCGCTQIYYAESKQQWWDNPNMRWIHGPPEKRKVRHKEEEKSNIFVEASVAIGEVLAGAGKRVVGD